MKERSKDAFKRRKYVEEHINQSDEELAKALNTSAKRIYQIRQQLNSGVASRSEQALRNRKIVLENPDKSSEELAQQLGITTRGVNMIKQEIERGEITLADINRQLGPEKVNGNGNGVVPPALRTWLTAAVEKKMRLKNPPKSLNALHKQIIASVPEEFSKYAHEITKKSILDEFEDLFWRGRSEFFKSVLKAGYTSGKVHELLAKQVGDRPVPPKWAIEAKFNRTRGVSKAPRETDVFSLPGVLRVPLAEAPPLELQRTSYKEPFHALPNSDKDRFHVGVISGVQLGIAYNLDIELNLTRCGFAAARKEGCDAVIVTGGLFRVTWQKTAGPNRLLNDLAMGTEIDLESIALAYRPRMEAVIKSGEFVPLFTTAKERFIDVLRGWYKVLTQPGKKPEFSGPVYVVLGPEEEGLVRRMAYFELLYLQSQELGKAEAEKSLHDKLAVEAFEEWNNMEHDSHFTQEEVKEAQLAYLAAEQEAAVANEMVNRLRMTNLNERQNKRVYKQAFSYLLYEIKKHIPTWQIIDKNAAFMKFGKSKHIIKVVSADGSNPHYSELRNYGPTQRKGELPALTIVSHPGALYMRKTSRENYRKGSMLGTAGFVEAPMLVDAEAILEAMEGAKASLPVVRAVSDSMFNGGMMIVKIDPELGVTPDFLSVGAIRTRASPGNTAKLPPAKKLYLIVATDPHFGGAMRVRLRRPSGLPIGLTEAVFELMQRSGLDKHGRAPVAGLFVCDDITHGNHYDTHVRPHYNVRPFAQILEETEKGLNNLSADPIECAEQLKGMLLESIDQISYRPPDYLTGQFEELIHGLLRAYNDVFSGIILSAHHANVIVKGVSDFSGKRGDTRDVGLINFGSGNHATKTTEGMMHEGRLVAELVRGRLSGVPALQGIDLDRAVKGPLFQDTGIAYGTIRVGNGYEWGLHVAGTPPKRDSWLDVLHGWVLVNRGRGDTSSVLGEKSILHLTGDKHFFAGAFAGNDVYVMGPSSTHTDSFADKAGGLPENNAGVALVGLPVDGPDAGEISVFHLTPEMVQHFLTTGEPFPWDRALPNNILREE